MQPHHPIKIVFFDIDETLYIKSEKRIPLSVIEQVIPPLRAKGIIPAIATGRCIGSFPQALTPLLNEQGFELLVTINGQYNRYREQLISHYPLSQTRIEQAIAKLNELAIPYGMVGSDGIAVSTDEHHLKLALSPIKSDYLIDPTYYQRHTIYQLLAFFSADRESDVITSGLLQDDLKIIRWHEYAVDLLSQHHSKAMGITDTLRYLGLKMENAMAFGDGLNDIEMLSSVGLGVAMGNGDASLKKVADYVTLPIEQDGILHALKQLGII